ncbi:hypothetical protein [Aquimarina sp. MMG016]|uniref:hypothetical protein n=1 Tax=Aquimarina sp. MMG016 TaxID=2822690 RepID=UPI001B3A4D21|nr:hypothetical protein [Aquimarina sp. MMG016]MBQ4822101.1 hypothetical protein [Aquimarina sp. MMG016]
MGKQEEIEENNVALALKEYRLKKIDIIIKYVIVIISIITLGISIYKYNKSKEDQFVNFMSIERYTVYKKLCNTLSSIAYNNDSISIDNTKKELWKIYHGEVLLVSDDDIYQKLMEFTQELDKKEQNLVNKDTFEANLTRITYDMVLLCKNSIAESHKLSFEKFKPGY